MGKKNGNKKCLTQALLILFTSIMMGSFIVSWANAQTGKDIIHLKFSHDGVPESVLGDVVRFIAEKMKERTNGRVVLDVYWKHSLSGGDLIAAAEMTQAGTLDMVVMASGVFSNWDKRWVFYSLPFLTKDIDEYYKLLNAPLTMKLMEDASKLNLKPIRVLVRPFRQLLIVNKEIRKPEDMRGMKFRVPENPAFIAAFKAIGAVPVPTSWGEVYTALKLRTVDGMETPTTYIISEKFYEVVKCVTFWNYATEGMIVLFNKNSWEKLPKDVKAKFIQTIHEAGDLTLEKEKNEEKGVVDFLKKKGVTVTILTPEEIDAFRKLMAVPVWNKIRGDIGEEFFQEGVRYLETIRGK